MVVFIFLHQRWLASTGWSHHDSMFKVADKILCAKVILNVHPNYDFCIYGKNGNVDLEVKRYAIMKPGTV